MIMQSRLQSLIESCVNVAIGYGVALTSQILVFPWFGLHVPLSANLQIGAIFNAHNHGNAGTTLMVPSCAGAA